MADNSGMGGSWVMPLMTVFSGALDYASKSAGAKAMVQAATRKQEGANFQAAQLEQQAVQQEAASQIGASEEARKARYLQSRAIAIAAMQGGSTTDPTVLGLRARLAADAAYNEAMKLQQGAEAARGLRMQASSARYMGDLAVADAKDAQGAARLAAGAGMVKTGSALYAMSPKTLASDSGGKTMFQKYNISDTPQLRPSFTGGADTGFA